MDLEKAVTAIDEDVELVVDLEAEIPCEARSGCDQAATWKISTLPCAHGVVLCLEHKVHEDGWFAYHFEEKKRVFCRVCGSRVTSIRWDEL